MPAAIKLGCIADDFTGATDLANNLARSGMRVTQVNGVPQGALAHEVDAVVVALKSRTEATSDAVTHSLSALSWLQAQGAQQIYFKYCSTFDSWYAPDRFGNIGPVTEALMEALKTNFTVATPAFPDNGRTVFKGHLFVGDMLLSDSSMKDHPVTPMRESNLVTVLQGQSKGKVGLIDHRSIARGQAGIAARMEQLRQEGVSIAVMDAVSNADLMVLGKACAGLSLVTAGSGLAIGLAQNFGLSPRPQATQLPVKQGYQAVVSGSCSAATNRQVAHALSAGVPSFCVDAIKVAAGEDVVAQALAWARSQWAVPQKSPLLIYSTAEPSSVRAIQEQIGGAQSGAMLERSLAAIAKGLAAMGVQQLIVAGGETSGACVQALDVAQMQIGPQIDPGVPWCYASATAQRPSLHLALKSGNFGSDDFFTKAFAV